MATKLLIGKDLPNLKITLGVDKNEMSTSSSDDEMIVEEPEVKNDDEKQNETIVNSIIPEKPVRKYVNKQGGFDTGLDLSSQGQEKLQQRAERFGLDEPAAPSTQQESIDDLYSSLGVSLDNPGVRLDTIHLRGVEELSTEEIFKYFVLYGPSTLEWIDDYSCNVVWSDPAGAARALLGVSKPVEVKAKVSPATDDSKPQSQSDSPMEEPLGPALPPAMEEDKPEEVILVTDDEDSEEDNESDSGRRHRTSSKTAPPAVEPSDENMDKEEPQSRPLLLTTRGRQWRLGEAHPKAQNMLMRFAFKDDKKLPGAEKRSVYYKKYGNPNYKGMKGLLTNTLRRRVRAQRKTKTSEDRQSSPPPPSHSTTEASSGSSSEEEEGEESGSSGPLSEEEEDLTPRTVGAVKRKRPSISREEEIKRRKMQLYSDVETRPRGRLPVRENRETRGIHSRLGSRPPQQSSSTGDLRDRISKERPSGFSGGDLRDKLNKMRR